MPIPFCRYYGVGGGKKLADTKAKVRVGNTKERISRLCGEGAGKRLGHSRRETLIRKLSQRVASLNCAVLSVGSGEVFLFSGQKWVRCAKSPRVKMRAVYFRLNKEFLPGTRCKKVALWTQTVAPPPHCLSKNKVIC